MTLIDIEPLLAEGWILARTVPTRYGKTTQTMSLKNVEVAHPTVDAVEVVRGRWEYDPVEEVRTCTNCGGKVDSCDYPNYCPHCGARMEATDGQRTPGD